MNTIFEKVGSLADQIVVVNGATGNVGEGIVRAALQAGARVIALGRNAERLETLRGLLVGEDTERLVTRAGDTTSFDGFMALASDLAEEHGHLDHVVSSVNAGWFQDKDVWEVDEAEFDRYVTPHLKSHYAAARALVPHLREDGSFTFIAGVSAIFPIPGISLMGICGGGQLMLANDLQADGKGRFRVNTLVLGYVISRDRPEGPAEWISADDVGRVVTYVANSSAKGLQLRLDDRPTALQTVAGLL